MVVVPKYKLLLVDGVEIRLMHYFIIVKAGPSFAEIKKSFPQLGEHQLRRGLKHLCRVKLVKQVTINHRTVKYYLNDEFAKEYLGVVLSEKNLPLLRGDYPVVAKIMSYVKGGLNWHLYHAYECRDDSEVGAPLCYHDFDKFFDEIDVKDLGLSLYEGLLRGE